MPAFFPVCAAILLLSISGAAHAACTLEMDKGAPGDWWGACKDGRAHGEGEATAADGSSYSGSAANGKRHGYGTARDSGGGYYRGEFRNGVPHGTGMIRDADGRYYRVEHRNGERRGGRVAVAEADARDPWGDDTGTREASAEKDPWAADRAEAADPWAPEKGSPGFAPAPTRRAAKPVRDDGKDDAAYRTALAALDGRREAARPGQAKDGYMAGLAALEKREADRREAELRAAEERWRAEERRERELIARQREDEARRRAASHSRDSTPSHSSRSSSRSSSSGLFKPDFGLNVLRGIDAQRQAQQREREQAERARRQQEEYRRGEAARRQQELERQRRQAAYERQRERQQAEAGRRQEDRRRRQEQARRQQSGKAAHAAHCLQTLRTSRGLNVANVRIRNACSFTIEVTGACLGTSFRANRQKGTYYPYENMGMYQVRPGQSSPAVAEEICNEKGRTARNIACRVPFKPHFTSPTGNSYACFE